jgi:uncharacterized protein
MEHFFSSKVNRILASAVLGLVVLALGAYAYFTIQQSRYLYTGPTTISVTGEAEVNSVPDIGQFSFSVVADGVDAKSAQEASATKINEIIAALEAAGVARADIKTEYFSLSPKFRYETQPCIAGMYCPGESVPDGFEVSQTIMIKVRTLDNSGMLLGLVGDNGATNISDFTTSVDDDASQKDEARKLAIADAREKAEVLAESLGVRLTKMVGYYEDEQGTIYPYYGGMGGDMMMAKEDMAVAPDVPVGENTTVSRVTLTYQVK